ncbi:hypothetical protein B0H19DRAFT_1141418 [Mycena capillaripes]|nr:hypothetical protein B0H19DRAFT_1141418 [Mycena capillaripes]
MSSDPSPFFPPELEREMFELAAELYPETIPNLLLVSMRVYEWIDRIKYRTITPAEAHRKGYSFRGIHLQSTCSLTALRRAVRSNSKPASFFRDHVRHLFTQSDDGDALREILLACRGIQHLALVRFVEPVLVPALSGLRPRRLIIYWRSSIDWDLCRPMFSFTTHLEILDHIPQFAEQFITKWLPFLAQLPALTHLSFFWGVNVATQTLASCSKLEVLVCTHPSPAPHSDLLNPIADEQFVYIAVPDPLRDWITGTNGCMDYWACAEAFVVKKRRGEIQPNSRCWIEDEDGVGPGYKFAMESSGTA